MSQWVARGWGYTDKNWPFGRNEKRHEGAAYYLIRSGNRRLKTTQSTVGTLTRIAVLGSSMTSSRARPRYQASSATQRYRDGLQQGREEKTRYPSSCVLQVSLKTHLSMECPGVLSVNLVGYGNRPGGTAQSLSEFRLRAIKDSEPVNLGLAQTLSYGRRLNGAWIDMSIGRSWIRECETRHGTKCSEHGWALAMRKPGFLRVTDAEDYCIVEATDPATCRFVALPYV